MNSVSVTFVLLAMNMIIITCGDPTFRYRIVSFCLKAHDLSVHQISWKSVLWFMRYSANKQMNTQDQKNEHINVACTLLSNHTSSLWTFFFFFTLCSKCSYTFVLFHSLHWGAVAVSGRCQSWMFCCWPARSDTLSAWRPVASWRKSTKSGTFCSTPCASPSSRMSAASTSENGVSLEMTKNISSLPKTVTPLLTPKQRFAQRSG